jgi:nucleotide-binding universal stress UspA family protein
MQKENPMSYRTILVHVDDSRRANERIKIAANMALAEHAHLIGAAATGVSSTLNQIGSIDPIAQDLATILDTLHERADHALAEFETLVQRMGVTSFETRLVDDEAGGAISLQARYSDLVVIGQKDPAESASIVARDFPEFVVMNSGRPVLIIPHAGQFVGVGKRPLIAWDAGTAAAKAVADAIPFLRHAEVVDVVVFNPDEPVGVHGEEPGADIALYLARHDIKVNVRQQTATTPIGDALLLLATELASDLIVMGGYGHARLREILLGGVTRSALEYAIVPVLMSH